MLVFFGTIVAIIMALGRANPLNVFLGIEAVFVVLALIAWLYVDIHFEGSDIIRRVFFIQETRHPISAIRKIRFDAEEDSFGGRTLYVTIELIDTKPFFLFDFSRADLIDIVGKISKSRDGVVVDIKLDKYLNKPVKKLKSSFRPGDRIIFIGAS